jgi:hypothetical protein
MEWGFMLTYLIFVLGTKNMKTKKGMETTETSCKGYRLNKNRGMT